MTKFTIEYKEIATHAVEIEAPNERIARAIVRETIGNGDSYTLDTWLTEWKVSGIKTREPRGATE